MINTVDGEAELVNILHLLPSAVSLPTRKLVGYKVYHVCCP